MKLQLIIILTFTISWCGASDSILCQHYDEALKYLQIFCEQSWQGWPQNCTFETPPSLNPSNVIHLKVEQCDENLLRNISETYANVQRLDISFSNYPSFNWTGIAFNNANELNVTSNGLTTVPTELLKKVPKLSTLDLGHNLITNISSSDFQNVTKITKINLSFNQLDSIDANAFAKLMNLKSLNLRNNRFTSLPVLNKLAATEIDFQENSLLTTFDCKLISTLRRPSSWLNLTWHHITAFRGDQNCRKRKIVDVVLRDGDGIHIISPGIELALSNNESLKNIQTFVAGDRSFIDVRQMFKFLGSSVMKMDLTGNNVYELSSSMLEQFPNLNELVLSDTALKEFDFNVFDVSHQYNLNRLDISNNEVKIVQNADRLSSFQNLIDLSMAGNQIQNAHEIFRNLTSKVQRLNLAGTHIGNAYSFNTFGRLFALEYLNLSDTNLWILDANPFIKLRNLITLDLSHNNLQNCDFTISSSNLTELRVSNSRITNATEIIGNLRPSVQILDLSRNNIASTIDLTSMQHLSNLTHLNLSGTHLQKFDLKALVPLSELRTLDISNNQLQNIDLNALENFTQLERFYLNGNDLTKLDISALSLSPYVSYAISRNQFSCMYLKELKRVHPYLTFIDNPLDQKHGEDCLATSQAIGDFLGSVFNKVKFW